ncbi:MAG: response regulator [Cellvibrionaceae bacterium]|nr:response regulator [Cellvibrionaceae bacterium]
MALKQQTRQDKVLIVDDEVFIRKALTRSLKDDYQLQAVASGDECLQSARQWQPDVILLDVEMPGKNGFEVCDEIKRDPLLQSIPVVFLSSHTDLRQRMHSFDVGGDDYLMKSSDKELILYKLKHLCDKGREHKTLAHQVQAAQQTSLEALNTSFELGKAVRFIEQTYQLGSYETLAAKLLQTLTDLGLKATVLMMTVKGEMFFSNTAKQVPPLEIEVIRGLHSDKRFTDFGCRTQTNYPRVALLVKNMPLEDRGQYGRLKDFFPFVLCSTDAKICMLDAEEQMLEQQHNLTESAKVLDGVLSTIGSRLTDNRANTEAIISAAIDELNVELPKMGLDDDQEKFIFDTFDNIRESLYSQIDSGKRSEAAFAEVSQLLVKMTEKQDDIIKNTFAFDKREELDTDSLEGDVDLF